MSTYRLQPLSRRLMSALQNPGCPHQTRSSRQSGKATRWPPRQACPSFPPLRPWSVGASSRKPERLPRMVCVRPSQARFRRDVRARVDGLRDRESHALAWASGRCERHYSNTVLGVGNSTHTFLSGARFTGRPKGGRVNPFGQFLAGFQYTNVHGLGISESLVNFAIQPGGGVDIKLSDSLAVRVQLDHRTSFHDGFHSGAFRFAPGIVISRGRKTF